MRRRRTDRGPRLPVPARLFGYGALATLLLHVALVAHSLVEELPSRSSIQIPPSWPAASLALAALLLASAPMFLARIEWGRRLLILALWAEYAYNSANEVSHAIRLSAWETSLRVVFSLAGSGSLTLFVVLYLGSGAVVAATRGNAEGTEDDQAARRQERSADRLPGCAIAQAVGWVFLFLRGAAPALAMLLTGADPNVVGGIPWVEAILCIGAIGFLRRRDWGRQVLRGGLIVSCATSLGVLVLAIGVGHLTELSAADLCVGIPGLAATFLHAFATITYLSERSITRAMRGRRAGERRAGQRPGRPRVGPLAAADKRNDGA